MSLQRKSCHCVEYWVSASQAAVAAALAKRYLILSSLLPSTSNKLLRALMGISQSSSSCNTQAVNIPALPASPPPILNSWPSFELCTKLRAKTAANGQFRMERFELDCLCCCEQSLDMSWLSLPPCSPLLLISRHMCVCLCVCEGVDKLQLA